MNKTLKRKTAMVLYQLEETLGNFVISNSDSSQLNEEAISKISIREEKNGRKLNKNNISDIIEATYLSEIFDFSLEITKESSLHEKILFLYDLFHKFGVYEIRNSIAHPNRAFLDCYWYRIAAIASDPIIDKIGLEDVRKSFISAENGTLEDPPEDWYKKSIWKIPNNLPYQFEHTVTGLIGRNEDSKKLKDLLLSPRVNTIAIVAPGGIGKTALALELLNDLVTTPEISKEVDGVIFISMKTERLSAEGIISLDAVETIEQIKDSILNILNDLFEEDSDSFEKALKLNYNKKLLLFLDNLETLLRDDQETFEVFNLSLPPTWRVLVTSRMSIPNASIVSLKNLKANSAIHLARLYITKRGGEPLKEDVYKNLTEQCHFNPLAIRLTLDRLLSGYELLDSISVTNKDIAEFSFNNLIETLSDNALKVLEAIFVEDKSTRISLCELLGLSMDDIAGTISELSRTSLIVREISNDSESYSLNSSVKELLLRSPKNIAIRSDVQNLINDRRVRSKDIDIKQTVKRLPAWHISYVPKDLNESLKILVTELNTSFNNGKLNTERAIYFYKRFSDVKALYENEAIFHRSIARIYVELRDPASAEKHFNKAIQLDINDDTSKYLLARFFHDNSKYEESEKIYAGLKSKWSNPNKEDINFGKTILNGYFLSLLYNGKYDRILEETKTWKDNNCFCGLLGSYRASAWKRKMENIIDPTEAISFLLKAMKIIDEVFRREGYIDVANKQAVNIMEEIVFYLSKNNCLNDFPKESIEFLKFIEKHIFEISTNYKAFSDIDVYNLIEKIKGFEISDNPFLEKKWQQYSTPSFSFGLEFSEIVEKGFVFVTISNIPTKHLTSSAMFSNFLFAKDENQLYFIHFNSIKNGEWQDWKSLKVGMKLAINPKKNLPDEKGIKVGESYFVSF